MDHGLQLMSSLQMWRVPINRSGLKRFDIPRLSLCRGVAYIHHELCILLEVDPEEESDDAIYIEVFGTRDNIPNDEDIERDYLGTVAAEPFVWHIYERVSPVPGGK